MALVDGVEDIVMAALVLKSVKIASGVLEIIQNRVTSSMVHP